MFRSRLHRCTVLCRTFGGSPNEVTNWGQKMDLMFLQVFFLADHWFLFVFCARRKGFVFFFFYSCFPVVPLFLLSAFSRFFAFLAFLPLHLSTSVMHFCSTSSWSNPQFFSLPFSFGTPGFHFGGFILGLALFICLFISKMTDLKCNKCCTCDAKSHRLAATNPAIPWTSIDFRANQSCKDDMMRTSSTTWIQNTLYTREVSPTVNKANMQHIPCKNTMKTTSSFIYIVVFHIAIHAIFFCQFQHTAIFAFNNRRNPWKET